MEELKALCDLENERLTNTEKEANRVTLDSQLGYDTTIDNMISIPDHIGRYIGRSNVKSSEERCQLMCLTNR